MNKDFRSDNVAPPLPQILEAAVQGGGMWMDAYGDDQITGRLEERLAEIFEHEVAAFPILTGTAANALALAQMSGRFGQILCHRLSHVYRDECGAVEFHSQGRLKALDGKNGKLDTETCARGFGFLDDVHQLRTTALSLSQATEVGTYYSADEVLRLANWAKGHDAAVHMDGTRFANVVVASGSTPAELTWRAGVDVLCLGATKGGAIGTEVVVFFEHDLADDFKRLMKRSGHLPSRLWFLAAQLEAYFDNDLWRESARHANAMACRLGDALSQNGIAPCYPAQTNMVFLKADMGTYERLRKCGFKFYLIDEENEGITARFVMSYATNTDDVERLAEAIINASYTNDR